jgi:NADPH-dependent 2,4-dienoyl-CoA reductase/sulfur reductase-like enzyme
VSQERVFFALGTIANKTGRVAGVNIGGGYATFPGVVGTAVTRICEVEIGRTGLSLAEAEAAGIEVVVGEVESTSRAGYFPGGADLLARVLVEKARGRIVGAQIVGADRVGKRIDVMATAITAGFDVAEVIDLDLAYAPAIATAWDPWQLAARRAARQL